MNLKDQAFSMYKLYEAIVLEPIKTEVLKI